MRLLNITHLKQFRGSRYSEMRVTEDARSKMNKIGMQLVEATKATVLEAHSSGKKLPSKDILSLLVQQNMSNEIPPHQRLTDKAVLGREVPITC